MEKKYKFSMWYVLLGIWVVLLIQSYLSNALAVKTIPYSEFLNLVKENRVTEVAISANQIQGKMNVDGGEQMFKTLRVDPDISALLEQHNVTFKGQVESTLLRDLFSWIFPIILFVGIWYFLIKRMAGSQTGFMTLGKNKAKIYMENEVKVTFKDAAGVDEAEQELVEVIDFLKEPGKFTQLGGKLPKGILLVGPPGTGKTLLAKAVAGESHVPFFSMSGSEFVEMFVGLGAARVRDLFEQAKQKAPCIIFIDELDALGKARGIGGMGGHDEREQTLNQLLVEMDGFDPKVGVILMAASNRPEILDPALLRPGRFDRHILVDRPDRKGREDILRVHLRNVSAAADVDVAKLAGMTPGMVGADLANLVNEAALLAVRRNKNVVSMAELEELLVSEAMYRSSNEGAGTTTKAPIIDDDALLFYAPRTPGLYVPSAGYTFVWASMLGGQRVPHLIRRIREERPRRDVVECHSYFDHVVTAAGAGYFFPDVTD